MRVNRKQSRFLFNRTQWQTTLNFSLFMKILLEKAPKTGWIILILLVFALGARCARCALTNRIDEDALIYMTMADRVASGNIDAAFEFNTRIPPLYPFLMAYIVKAGASAWLAGTLISVVAGTLLIIPVFVIANTLFGRFVAFGAAFLCATHPYLIRISADIMRDPLFLLFLFSSVMFAVLACAPSRKRCWYLSGCAAGLAVMTRTEGTEMILVLITWLGIEFFRSIKEKPCDDEAIKPFSRALKSLFYCLCVFVCFISMFMLVTIPVQSALTKTLSEWSIVDHRITGYVHDFFYRPVDDIIKQEKEH